MTTDEVPKTGRRRATKSSDDEFSSENYIAEFASENYIARFSPESYVGTHGAETHDETYAAETHDAETHAAERHEAETHAAERHEAETPESADTVVLGTVPGEFDHANELTRADIDETPADVDDDIDDSDDTSDDSDDVDNTADIDETAHSEDAAPTGEAVDEIEADTAIEESTAAEEDAEATPVDAGIGDGYLEMRQVAGLTAGSMMKLTVGRAFEFNESNEGGSFSLRVLENGEVIVHPGTAHAVIDEVEVDEPMLVGEALLNVSSACFSVRAPRPPASSESRMESIGAAFASISAITVPAIGAEEPLAPDQVTGSRLGTIINRNPLTRGAVGRRAWNFLLSIRQTRSVVAERHRLLHPDPEELKTRLSRLDPGLWERSREHPLFGRFSVGYANIPWEPKFDNPELIPEVLHEPVVEMSLLPWVPVTANLLYGPLGIVGKRAARLAACRHAILSLAALSMPGEAHFAIRSGKNTATSWSWARALPAIMSADDDSPYVVTIIDGADGARVDEAARQASHDARTDSSDDAGWTTASDRDDVVEDPDPTAEVPVIRVGPDGTLEPEAGGGVLEPGTDVDVEATGAGPSQNPGHVGGTATTGYIVLADSVDELTRPCGTVLQIEPDGTGSVTNHLNETIQVTPIGVTEAFAHDMATRIADILTKSFL